MLQLLPLRLPHSLVPQNASIGSVVAGAEWTYWL